MGSLQPKTVAVLRREIKEATREDFEVLKRALAADERKGVREAIATAQRKWDAEAAEQERLAGMYAFQKQAADGKLLMGLDEVGRGPVAGPLTVAAVVLPEEPQIEGLNDSKQISPENRERIAVEVKKHALAWDIEHISPADIDELGMSACLRLAFSRAIAAIDEQGLGVEVVLLDGNPLHIDEREVNVIKGDAQCASIAAASIIAKVERDGLMVDYAQTYPQYSFDKSKGYASADHIEAIKKYGLTPIHRATFCTSFIEQQQTLF